MDLRRLRIGEWLTGIAGIALLASMFPDWYEADGGPGATGAVNAWEAFAVLDVLVAIVALMAIAVAVMAAVHNTPAVSLAIASLLLTIGTITTIALLVRVLWLPDVNIGGLGAPEDSVSRSLGLWLGLLTTVVATLGALVTMRDQRFPQAARDDVPVEMLAPPEGGKA